MTYRTNKEDSQEDRQEVTMESPIKPYSPGSTPETLLSDISFLNNFKEKVLSQASTQHTGR